MKYLPQINCSIFLNADMIAAGLVPLGTGEKLLKAGKLFLHEIEQAQKRREDFAFETTLSGKSHLSSKSHLSLFPEYVVCWQRAGASILFISGCLA